MCEYLVLRKVVLDLKVAADSAKSQISPQNFMTSLGMPLCVRLRELSAL